MLYNDTLMRYIDIDANNKSRDFNYLWLYDDIRYFPDFIAITAGSLKAMYKSDKVLLLPHVHKHYVVRLVTR